MAPERWQQIKEVFQTACERHAAARAAYLDEACAGDPALRAEVESLLSALRQAADFLEKPAPEKFAPRVLNDLQQDLVGKHIGPYQLVRQIGQGGVGLVYFARRRDGQYEKAVAIKLIKRGMDTDDILRRFRHERQTLATLDHLNIARLLDGGVTEEGLPYFVMEYIEGAPIDVYCDTHKLNTIARLELFRTVCAAVHYAHQNLIVHRDLKPSNILVNAEGAVKLLDFGIAKLLHPPSAQSLEMTVTGRRLMTPEYASPEQIRGELITTASDVYSLGVLLYKLLTGHRPYRFEATAAVPEIARVICETPPPKPSTVIGQIEEARGPEGAAPTRITPESVSKTRDGHIDKLHRRLVGDLDNIVLMALRKEPQRRYTSVEQFAEDIRRHLEGRPVIAHKDTLAYRGAKFIKRHKTGVIAAVLLLLTLWGGMIGVIWQARIAVSEGDKAKLEAAKAQQINRFVQEMLAAVDPYKSGKDVTIADVLGEAAKRVDKELSGQPEIAAEVRTTLGTTYQNLGQYDKAAPLLESAYETRRQLLGNEHPAVAMSIKNLALLRHYQGDFRSADSLYRLAISIFRRTPPPAASDFAGALNDYGTLLHDLAKYEPAVAVYREALTMYVQLFGNSHQEVAAVSNNLALTLHEEGRLDSAETLYRNALAIYGKIYGEEHPDVAHALNNLAFVLNDKGEPEAASQLFKKSLEIRRRLFGDSHPDVIRARHNLAGILYYQKEYAAAEQMVREAIAAWETTLPHNHPDLANSLFWLGRILIALGKPQQAESPLRKSLQIRRTAYPQGHFLIAKAQIELGKSLLQQHRYREAEILLKNGYATFKVSPGDQAQNLGETLQLLSHLYKTLHKPARAAHYDSLLVSNH